MLIQNELVGPDTVRQNIPRHQGPAQHTNRAERHIFMFWAYSVRANPKVLYFRPLRPQISVICRWRSRARLLFLTLGLMSYASAAFSQALPICPADASATPLNIADWIVHQPTSLIKQAQAMMRRLPAGNSIDILVNDLYANQKSYYGVVKWRLATQEAPSTDWLPLSPIWSREVAATDPFVLAGNSWATGKTRLSFDLPQSFESFNSEVTLAFAACGGAAPLGKDRPADFTVILNASTSSRFWSLLLATGIVVIGYIAAASALSRIQNRGPTLNPVVLTAGWDGRGSPAKMQLLFFTLIVTGLLTYILSRAGFLSDLSKTVLILMGISSVGAIAARSTDVSKNRLDYDNWAWAVRKGWLPKEGFAGGRRPEWKDLLTIQGEFDVSRFQLVVFSVVVGIALLQIGLTDLSTFSVPDALLGLLGLSQVTYVFGKALGSTDITDLNTGIKALRTCEEAFVAKAGVTDDPTPMAPGIADPPPGNLLSAQRRTKLEYSAYAEKEQNVRIMFETSLGLKLQKVEPRYI